MKFSLRNSLIISVIFFCLMIQVYPINAETILEFQVKIGDVMNYSVVKLNQLSKNADNVSIRENIQLSRTIWDIYGSKFTYLEQQGTLYTFTVIKVNNSCVSGDLEIDNELISQVDITSLNSYQGFIIKTTSNKTYFEQLCIDNSHYELNQSYLYETESKVTAGGPTVTAVVKIHNVWDIETGWLESCHYTAYDSSLTNEIGPILYGMYEYEIVGETLTKTSTIVSWIPLTILIPLICIILCFRRSLVRKLIFS